MKRKYLVIFMKTINLMNKIKGIFFNLFILVFIAVDREDSNE